MLNNTGFDLWADGYDKSVGLSDENDRYPFAVSYTHLTLPTNSRG